MKWNLVYFFYKLFCGILIGLVRKALKGRYISKYGEAVFENCIFFASNLMVIHTNERIKIKHLSSPFFCNFPFLNIKNEKENTSHSRNYFFHLIFFLFSKYFCAIQAHMGIVGYQASASMVAQWQVWHLHPLGCIFCSRLF